MLFSIIQTIDLQNRIHLAYESLFEFVVQQSHEVQVSQRQLRRSKLRRVFKAIEYHKLTRSDLFAKQTKVELKRSVGWF